MKVLTIIGNGFDLGHNLPTKFDDFIDSNYEVFSEKYSVFRDEKETNWKDVEGRYKKLLCKIIEERNFFDVMEEVENILQNYGVNQFGEVNYYNYISEAFDAEYKEIDFLVELLKEFEIDFLEYLKVECNDDKLKELSGYRKIASILSESKKIINFNYTNTVEILYGMRNVVHVHGNINDDIVIGCESLEAIKQSMIESEYPNFENVRDKHDFAEIMSYYEEDMEGELLENHFIKRFFDEVSSSTEEIENDLFKLLDEKNKDLLPLRKQVIEELEKEIYDKVYVIGHSLGEADNAILNSINQEAKIYCFYHTHDDYERMKKILINDSRNFELLSNAELYNP